MKFKILPGCKLFDTLQEADKSVIAARIAIKDRLKAMGFSGEFASASHHSYLVSCDAIEILSGKPPGWKQLGESYQNLYWPLASNKKTLKELSDLPQIKNEVVNEPLGFSFHVGNGLGIYYRPGVLTYKDYILINTESANYTPVEGMVEILESEYNQLAEAIKE